ncbi:hypothetical protein NADFUDRAFT_76405 [Nadsonia fulvescens var. elongata DSM 6958]|uniref:ATP-dependent bile acid permease n=1 Tax=Nadsonia fulvescens var. elongata DSM 6958 TaxID=857566 RepID=A0A1E3PRZ0_9ASCO|nr:hypothetical protein NADFUDRAFT_76405 [Nadsonia fulvescens var. elongata DSM 6958]
MDSGIMMISQFVVNSFSALYTIVTLGPKFIAFLNHRSKFGPSCSPLLTKDSPEDDYEQNGLITPSTRDSYGSISDENENITDSNHFSEDSKSSIILASRSPSERLRLAFEALCLVAQTALSLSANFVDNISSEWYQSPYKAVPVIFVLFWGYLLTICLIRLKNVRQHTTPTINLWTHSAFLYFFAFLFSLPTFRSATLNPINSASRNYYFCNFFLVSALFFNIIFAKFGDRSPRIYVTPGIKPSPEPVSSIFSLCSFSWLNSLIWDGYQNSLNMEEIWDLREDDHAIYIINLFRGLKSTSSFSLRLLKSFKGLVAAAAFWAVFYSVLTFMPPLCLKYILEYVDNPTETPRNVAWLYIFAMLIFGIATNVGSGQALFIGRRLCIRLRAIIIGEVYAKALRRKVASGKEGSLGSKKGSDEDNETDTGDTNKDKENDNSSANLGAIINLMAVDAFKVSEIMGYLHVFIDGILTIILSVFFLYQIIGYSALAGAFTLIMIFPMNYYFSKAFANTQKDLMALTDKRIEKTNEVLQSIRIIKFFAWEQKFFESVNDIRAQELKVLKWRCIIWSFYGTIWFITPTLITLLSFGIYTMVEKKQLTTSVAFTSLALFNIMRVPMDRLADMTINVLQSKVSLDRIQEFLDEEETGKYVQLKNPIRGPNSPYIGFEKATFSWDALSGSKDFKLRDINISFITDKLNIIVGPTGSGKTSLLLALLGEMDILEGQVFLPSGEPRDEIPANPITGFTESTAYCSQQAWLLNDTVRNNILFASEFDENRYRAVVEACGLKRDLEILEHGDETEVGEKGITLSGGQKQRISLARALYCRARHLLLDDCLSAVDSHTALWIYQNCITGPLMLNRTCILVSHNVALTITDADYIVVMDNGRVKAQGNPADVAASGALGDDELIMLSASQPSSRIQSAINMKSLSNKDSETVTQKADALAKKFFEANGNQEEISEVRVPTGKLIQEETRTKGSVSISVYKGYLTAMGNYWYWLAVLAALAIQQVSNIIQSWWIREWSLSYNDNVTVNGTANALISLLKSSSDSETTGYTTMIGFVNSFSSLKPNEITSYWESTMTTESHSTVYYLGIYAALGVIYTLIITGRDLIVLLGGLTASRKLFNELLENVLYARLRFFDSTPLGRIMNRFSKDIEAVDQEIAPVALGMIHSLLSAAAIIILISIITPGFLAAAVFIALMYWFIGVLYLSTSRELKRLDSISKSPIYQHFGETLVGVPTIRAYGDEKRFIKDNLNKIDANNRPFFYLWASNRWLSFRVDFAGALVTFFAGAFVMFSIGKIDSGLAGLSLSYAIIFNENMLWVVRLYADNEMNMNSVERLQEFMNIERESLPIIPESRVPPNWPSRGEIQVKDLSLRYASDLPRVINYASFEVKPWSKVGIVGRTGAGKSTIITAFFRLLEAETGSITIDGIDISTIGLKDLRRGLAIIPQDPTLFTGTIRSNLDPFSEYTDKQIFEALRRVHLIEEIPNDVENDALLESGSKIENSENMNQFLELSSPVSEGGNNMSQGQRQLMCLARSLLKSPKVLLLDEATASIDYQTDAQIQETIREEFSQTTILTIAHRLRSIIDYDMILVMDAGRIVEYDEPHTLLQDKCGLFRDMCTNSGEMEVLQQLARQSFESKCAQT